MDFCIQAGLPQWTFALQEGAFIEQALMMPNGQNTVHLRIASPARCRRRAALEAVARLPAARGPADARQSRRYAVPTSRPAATSSSASRRPLLLRHEGDGADASALFVAPEDWNLVPLRRRARPRLRHARLHAFARNGVDDVDRKAKTCSCHRIEQPWEHIAALSPTAAWQLELTRRERLIAASHAALQASDTFLLPLAADQFIVRPATRDVDEAPVRAAGADRGRSSPAIPGSPTGAATP